MKVSLNWLKQYVDFTGSTEELADLLTAAGVEVEDIIQIGGDLESVVVAQILSSEKHPEADRLSVCQVDDAGGESRQIVCGATNYKVGDKVPLALPGAVLPGGFKIKPTKLRGVKSEGMMCSAKELKIGADAEGLLILPPETEVGLPLDKLYPPDTIFELEITPNRPDLLSYLGLAREVAALTGTDFTPPSVSRPGSSNDKEGIRPVEIRNADLCPYYSLRYIRKVRVGQSPAWLRNRLQSVGLRPINNIVDITNFVLLETGQPLHAFDAEKVGERIIVRTATEGEELEALDENTYRLRRQDLVIADDYKALAIAGVMGGEPSGVTEKTSEILLESARFDPASVRRTSRDLGLVSDSSYRFERGVDPAGILNAANRAIELILELAGGEVSGPLSTSGEEKVPQINVKLRHKRAENLLGVSLSNEQIEEILTKLGLRKQSSLRDKATEWRIPSYRLDLMREVDLIEELARVYGIDNIPSKLAGPFEYQGRADRLYDYHQKLAHELVARGFYQIRTWSLISEKDLKNCLREDMEALAVKNPLSEDHVYLRPSLLPGMLKVVQHNVNHGALRGQFFEFGRVYIGKEGQEKPMMSLAAFGPRREFDWKNKQPTEFDLHDLRGFVEELAGADVDVLPDESSTLSLGVEFRLGDVVLGRGGMLSPTRAREMKLPAALYYAELAMEAFENLSEQRRPVYREISRFPAIVRDIALVAPLDLPQHKIIEALRAQDEPLLREVRLFDLFQDPTGEKLPKDKKNLAYSLVYRSDERTLENEEVQKIHDKLVEDLEQKLPVELRA